MSAHFDVWSEPGLAVAPSSGPVFDSPSLQARKVGEPAAFGLLICEFKFRVAMPGLVRNALQQFSLVPTRFSKYRHCVEALGLGCREKFDQCLNG
jgi:hypothetical protein